MLGTYLLKVLSFAARAFVLRVDAFQIIAASAIALIAKLLGLEVAGDATTNVLAWIGVTGLIWAAVRFVTAPYFIWREDQRNIEGLESELSKPSYLQNQRLAEHFADARASLASSLGEIAMISERHVPARGTPTGGGLHSRISAATEVLYQFSDDTALVSMCRDYMQYASIIVDKKDNHEDHREDINEMHSIAQSLYPKLRFID